jgi:hypothetical protein
MATSIVLSSFMLNSVPELAANPPSTEGELILRKALRAAVPIAAVLGQMTGWSAGHHDPALSLALKKASKSGSDWKSVLSREPPPEGFYERRG